MARKYNLIKIEERILLESLLKDGKSIAEAALVLGIPRQSCHREVLRGVTEEERNHREWHKYNAMKAQMGR